MIVGKSNFGDLFDNLCIFFTGVKIEAENESKSGAFIRGPERIRIRIRIGVS